MVVANLLENAFIGQILKVCGILYLVYKFMPFINAFFNCFVNPGRNIKEFGAGTGAWAVITGCTDGIGKELAIELANKKFNLLLIARNQDKLQSLKEEINSKNDIEIKTLVVDFAEPGLEKFKKIEEVAKELPIHMLVNNVGKSHEHPKFLYEEEDKEIQDILNININSTVFLTKYIIPIMKKSVKSGPYRGLILSLGSFAGVVPTPLLTTYSSSKAFLQTFAASLGPELEKDKITVTNVIPYFVVSKMSKIRKPSLTIPTAKAYAKTMLNKIEVAGGSDFPNNSTPYFMHAIINVIVTHFANTAFWIWINQSTMINTRSKALKKKEREAKQANINEESSQSVITNKTE